VKAPKRGAPKRADRFAAFLDDVLGYVVVFGGRPIFNRGTTPETATGNVVDLLDVLRPIMPPGFIPKKGQRIPRIERLATKARGSSIDLGCSDGWISRRPQCPVTGRKAQISFRRVFVFEEDRELHSEEDACPDCGGLGPDCPH
jgi:hypothetical protein